MPHSEDVDDPMWGCRHGIAADKNGTIQCCKVTVKDVKIMAAALTERVLDTSWISTLDRGTALQYRATVGQTGEVLKGIFTDALSNSQVKENFGELMVSMGAARSLGLLFHHIELPLAELWKSRIKQNDGFDFHTTCAGELIHFGEAKFSSTGSPYTEAILQVSDFLLNDKHHRDRAYLRDMVGKKSLDSLEDEKFGIVAAFSINAKNEALIMKNAVNKAIAFAKNHDVSSIFVIGVVNEAP